MKTPHSTQYRYNAETVTAANKLTPGTVSEQQHKLGMENGEPLIVIMDALHKYAAAYRIRFDGPLAEDYVLGPLWLQSAQGIRGLLNGDGAQGMIRGNGSDSKDNGCVESMFWDALAVAGFDRE